MAPLATPMLGQDDWFIPATQLVGNLIRQATSTGSSCCKLLLTHCYQVAVSWQFWHRMIYLSLCTVMQKISKTMWIATNVKLAIKLCLLIPQCLKEHKNNNKVGKNTPCSDVPMKQSFSMYEEYLLVILKVRIRCKCEPILKIRWYTC